MINYKEKTFKIILNDFLFNAGVMGFLNILIDNGDLDIENLSQSNIIELPFSILDDFEEKYIRTMVSRYKHLGVFHQLVREYEKLNTVLGDESYKGRKFILEGISELTKKSSFISVFRMMEDAPFEITGSHAEKEKAVKAVMSNLKKELRKLVDTKTRKLPDEEKKKIVDSLYDIHKPLIEKIMEHKDDFFMKEIMYLVVNKFWLNRGFLSQSKLNDPIAKTYNEGFVMAARWQLDNPVDKKKGKTSIQCLECGNDIKQKQVSKDGLKLTIADNFIWIVDKGIDSKRKTSIFWDGNPDDHLCPICKLIYSCIPLGFKVYKSIPLSSMFINSNYSIHSMYNLNVTMQGEETNENEFEYYRFADIAQRYFKAHIDYVKDVPKTSGLQMVRKRDEGRFSIDLISPCHMIVMKDRLKNFDALTNKYIKGKKDTLNVYQDVVNAFINNQNLSKLVGIYIRAYLTDMNFNPYFLFYILEIQDYVNYLRKGGNRLEYKNNELIAWKMSGLNLRKKLGEASGEVDNSIKRYYFRLSGAVKVGDVKTFIDTMMRMHLPIGAELPYKTEVLLESVEKFETYGQAYLIGLLSKTNYSNNKEEVSNGK